MDRDPRVIVAYKNLILARNVDGRHLAILKTIYIRRGFKPDYFETFPQTEAH